MSEQFPSGNLKWIENKVDEAFITPLALFLVRFQTF